MFRLTPLSLALGLCLGFFSSLHAATTSNFSYPDTSWPGDLVSSTSYLASSFTTNASASSYILETVILNMGVSITADGGFTLELRSSSSSKPGTVIAQLVGESTPSDGLYTYTTSSTVTLSSNTTYWLVARVSGDGEYRWKAAVNNNQTGDWSIGNNAGFSSNGTSWSLMSYPPYLFTVNATAVPEPSALLITAASLIGTGLRRRRA